MRSATRVRSPLMMRAPPGAPLGHHSRIGGRHSPAWRRLQPGGGPEWIGASEGSNERALDARRAALRSLSAPTLGSRSKELIDVGGIEEALSTRQNDGRLQTPFSSELANAVGTNAETTPNIDRLEEL